MKRLEKTLDIFFNIVVLGFLLLIGVLCLFAGIESDEIILKALGILISIIFIFYIIPIKVRSKIVKPLSGILVLASHPCTIFIEKYVLPVIKRIIYWKNNAIPLSIKKRWRWVFLSLDKYDSIFELPRYLRYPISIISFYFALVLYNYESWPFIALLCFIGFICVWDILFFGILIGIGWALVQGITEIPTSLAIIFGSIIIASALVLRK